MEEPHWNVGSCIQLHLKFCYRVQPLLPHVQETAHLLVDVTLGLVPCTITAPNASKFVQKLRECTGWAQKKAEAFQAKEAQRHKHNYNKRGRAVALEVGDTVLVYVTGFKGCHKIQDRWENREYVMEKWPYPNVPVYVVYPRDGEVCSWTLHRNYLLPINSNLEQGKKDEPMVGAENDTSPPPALSMDKCHLLSQDCLGWSCQTWQITHPRAVQIDLLHLDMALRPPGTDFLGGTKILGCWPITGPTGIWDAWVDLCIFLCVVICLYAIFRGCTV